MFRQILQQYEDSLSTGERVFFDAEDFLDIADYYRVSGKADDALTAAKRCMELYPDNANALLTMALVYVSEFNDVEKAKECIAKIPNTYAEPAADLVRAEIMVATKQWDRAETYVRRYLDNSDKRDDDGAFDDDIDDAPSACSSYLDVASLYMEYGNTAAAERWMRLAPPPAEDEKADWYDLWARIFFAKEDWQAAIDNFNKLLDIDAYDADAWLALCEAYYNTQRFSNALQCTEYAISINPLYADAYFTKGSCLLPFERYAEAIGCFTKFLEICPHDTLAELHLASAYYGNNEPQKAADTIRCVLSKLSTITEPYIHDAYRMAVMAYSMCHDKAAAEDCCDIIEQKYGYTEAECMRNIACINMGEDASAARHAYNALDESGYNDDVFLSLATSYLSMNYITPCLNIITLNETISRKRGINCISPRLLCIKVVALRHTEQYEEYVCCLLDALQSAPSELETALRGLIPEEMTLQQFCKEEVERIEKLKRQ